MWHSRLSIVLVLAALSLACSKAGVDPPASVDTKTRDLLADMSADTEAVWWVRSPVGTDLASLIERTGGRLLGKTDDAAMWSASRSVFLKAAAAEEISAAGFLCSADAAVKLGPQLQMGVLGALGKADAPSMQAKARLVAEPTEVQVDAMRATGAELGTVVGMVVTLSATPETLIKLAELDFVSRLEGVVWLQPMQQMRPK